MQHAQGLPGGEAQTAKALRMRRFPAYLVMVVGRNMGIHAVVTALATIARALGKETVTEFVQDQPTLDLLRELRVDQAQGYHIGHPRALATAAGSPV